MRTILVLASGLLLASCASKGPRIPASKPLAPTVSRLSTIDPPSTAAVSPLIRNQAREIERARSENKRLQRFVFESKQTNDSLEEVLHKTMQEGQADHERLIQIDVLVHKEKLLNKELQSVTTQQALTVSLISSRNEELSDEVQTLGEKISVSNQRLTDTGFQLDTANERIEVLTETHNAAAESAIKWKGKADTASGAINTERRWKWRFFWWGASVSLLIGVYIFVKMHPATRVFVP